MDLSIVIVNWNGVAVLKDCLSSIFSRPQNVSYEVLVVDNASTDESVAMVKAGFPQAIVIQNERNLGFSAANNIGFKAAKGRYILLLNSDTIVLDAALVDSVAYLDGNPSVGALGCRCEFPDRSFQTSCYRFTDLTEIFMVRVLPLGSVANERLNFARYWGRQFSAPTDVDVVAGCFLAVRREVVDSVGGLDEDFFMYGEDEEWCSRIKRGGWRIVYLPSAKIIHLHRFSSSKALRTLKAIECLSPVLVLHKRRGVVIAWAANVLLLLGLSLRMPLWLVRSVLDKIRGRSRPGVLRSRFVAMGAHFKGILSPVWIPSQTS